MASLTEFGGNLSAFYLFSVQEMFVFPVPWKFPEILANWLLHLFCWLLVSSLVYPGHVSSCLETRDSFPYVVQKKCLYFPACKKISRWWCLLVSSFQWKDKFVFWLWTKIVSIAAQACFMRVKLFSIGSGVF